MDFKGYMTDGEAELVECHHVDPPGRTCDIPVGAPFRGNDVYKGDVHLLYNLSQSVPQKRIPKCSIPLSPGIVTSAPTPCPDIKF